jgi:hypothetical protein
MGMYNGEVVREAAQFFVKRNYFLQLSKPDDTYHNLTSVQRERGDCDGIDTSMSITQEALLFGAFRAEMVEVAMGCLIYRTILSIIHQLRKTVFDLLLSYCYN